MAEKSIELALNVTLPVSLAHEAEVHGLLTPHMLEAMLREEVRRRRVAHLFAAADQLAALPTAPLTEAEVEAEIQAARTARRTTHACDC